VGKKDIKYDQHNYRDHDERNLSLIKKSIQRCGAGRSILLDKNGEIIAGNATYKTLQELGIPVKIIPTDGKTAIALQRTDLDTNSRKRKELAAFDNSTSDGVRWNADNLAADFDLAELPQLGIEGLQSVEPEPEEIVEDEPPELGEVPTRTKPGDVWQLGTHRLLCGDSTVPTDVAKLMEGETADLLLTDPPYNVNYESADGKTIENDHMGAAAFLEFLTAAFATANEFLRLGGAFYIWHADSEGYNFRTAAKNIGWQIRQCLIWNKNCFVLGRQDYQWKHEPCLYGWKDGAAHFFVDDRTQSTVFEDKGVDFKKLKKEELVQLLQNICAAKVSTSVIDCDRPSRSEEHPTMKPVKLLALQIRNSSRMGEIVLDPFGGSGSTLIACEQLGRKARLVELDPKYCDVILNRWEKLTGGTATLCK
jgi:site-specific DNA-methyltransferase (adenine-specific)